MSGISKSLTTSLIHIVRYFTSLWVYDVSAKKEADNHVTSCDILYHCGKHLKMHCQGSKAEKSTPFLCKGTIPTSFCKLPKAALYLLCTVPIICAWTDNCCFPCMFSLSCCHKKMRVPSHYSSQHQKSGIGPSATLASHGLQFFYYFLLFTDQGHSGLNAERI